MGQASISSEENEQLRKSFWNYDLAANRKEVIVGTWKKMVEVAEMEMVILSILCDILENSEYQARTHGQLS